MKVIDQIWTKIKEHKKIVCLAHINPDGDAYASQIDLYLLIKKCFPRKKFIVLMKNQNVFHDEINIYIKKQ